MFSSLGPASSEKLTALIEIGSGSVAAALLTVSSPTKEGDHSPMSVLYAKRHPMALMDTIDFKHFVISMQQALKAAVEDLEKALGEKVVKRRGRVEDIHVVFGAPWYLSRTKVSTVVEEKPFTVTDSMLEGLNKGAIDEFLASAEVTSGEQIEHKPKLIEHRPVQVLLNGYPTGKPHGKKASTVSVALYESVVSTGVFQSVFDTVYRSLGKVTAFHSASLMYFKSLSTLFPEPDNYLIANVEQEVTEVSLVEGDVIRETVSTPMGTNHLLRGITTSRKTVPEEALSLYLLATSMRASTGEEKALEAHLEKERVKALSSFAKTCTTLAGTKTLPSTLYIVAAPEFSTWFAGVFSDSSCAQYTSLGDPFIVKPLTPEFLATLYGAELGQFPDAQLALEALYVGKIAADAS